MTKIIPAILATTEEEYHHKLKSIEASGEFKDGWVQIDLMDNKFVQNKSIEPEVVSKYPTALKKEAHLMVSYPEGWIDELIKAGVQRIIFPVEDNVGIEERLGHIKNHGLEAGLALNPKTPVAKVVPFADKIDVLLVLSVEPGFGGQQFIPETIEKVKDASSLRLKGHNFIIEVDGGINERVAKSLVDAGADNLVIGSYLTDGHTAQNLEKLRQAFTS